MVNQEISVDAVAQRLVQEDLQIMRKKYRTRKARCARLRYAVRLMFQVRHDAGNSAFATAVANARATFYRQELKVMEGGAK